MNTNNKAMSELGKAGYEILWGSDELHEEGCELGKRLNHESSEIEESEVAAPDPDCLGCKAREMGFQLMNRLATARI